MKALTLVRGQPGEDGIGHRFLTHVQGVVKRRGAAHRDRSFAERIGGEIDHGIVHEQPSMPDIRLLSGHMTADESKRSFGPRVAPPQVESKEAAD